jgi:hypothetical protein
MDHDHHAIRTGGNQSPVGHYRHIKALPIVGDFLVILFADKKDII